ncbi:MAG TPA: PPOX class F420-dependent oxidoreductase [Nitrososphaerales archaeon]|nr:PPOX class F420-dependent oxidoreductase [Nitrososphaerales archaeon]
MMKSCEISFSDEEVDYLEQNRLARVATSSRSNQPHVVPVTYEFDGNFFYFGGWNLDKSLKFRNIQNNNHVALVIDDLATIKPWRPRGIEVRGIAEVQENNDGQYVKITPTHKISWGLLAQK